MRHLGAAELHSWLAASHGPVALLDVREPWEFEKCHIEGSRLIPLSQLPSRLGELDPERTTVVICHHGVRSFHVARFLEHNGFNRVINLTGGVDAWAKEVDPAMPTY